MKKCFAMLFVLMYCFAFSQAKQFLYEYRWVSDSTKVDSISSEIMVLYILDKKSEFFSSEKFKVDSTLLEGKKNGFIIMPTEKTLIGERIIKYNNPNYIEFITKLSTSTYLVKENYVLNWKLLPEYIKILNYNAQKATTEFGGRKWIAWFAKDIPFQDGPYKFSGLPGLIVKIDDEKMSHRFELKAIENISADFLYPNPFMEQKINLSSAKFKKKYRDYRKGPMAELVGMYPDQTDSEGNFKTGDELFKEHEARLIKALKSDNNIIEIDLLK